MRLRSRAKVLSRTYCCDKCQISPGDITTMPVEVAGNEGVISAHIRMPMRRRWFQLHMSTAFILTLVAAILIFFNIIEATPFYQNELPWKSSWANYGFPMRAVNYDPWNSESKWSVD